MTDSKLKTNHTFSSSPFLYLLMPCSFICGLSFVITIPSETFVWHERVVRSANSLPFMRYQIWQLLQSPFQQKSPKEIVSIERY